MVDERNKSLLVFLVLNKLLLIFYRNPELGKVKTRLARTVGDERALSIYLQLAAHTRSVTEKLQFPKSVCYSQQVDRHDAWPTPEFQKQVQRGTDLGERMQYAFAEAFAAGYTRVCIIGTDCLQLTTPILEKAFEQLEQHDAVLGPAVDGGYYLLGLTHLYPEVFQNKRWSTQSVAADTLGDFRQLGLKYFLLPTLSDVDEAPDLEGTNLL